MSPRAMERRRKAGLNSCAGDGLGPCKGCPADFDGSGDVGVKDLLILLGVWGPCP